MASDETLPETTTTLDLSALQSLNIGPEWATSTKPPPSSAPKNFRDDDRGPRSFGDRDRRPDRRTGGGAPGGPRRDGGFGGGDRGPNRSGGFGGPPRRDGAPNSGPGPRREGGFSGGPRRSGFGGGNDRGPRRDFTGDRGDDGFPRSDFPSRAQHFAPVVDIALYPEDKPFNVLIKAIKASLRTYDLFEIAHLILEKEDRFVVFCRPYDAERNPDARLYQSVPDGLPFLSESDAVAHVVKNHIDLFFSRETVAVEPPKGNFLMVSKCGFTGEILGPPNYHGYQQTLREHHAARLSRVPFDRFTSRIESVRDKEEVDKWLQSKTQVTRYTFKETAEGAEPVQFDSLDAARNYLLSVRKNKVVSAVTQLRFSGKNIATLPISPLRSAIDNEVSRQRRFLFDFANALRGRLRKLGLVLYKRGSKDITVVSAVERKFRTPGSVFADSIQRVFDFIEQKPFVKVSEFPEKFLGLSPEETEPAAETPVAPATAEAPAETEAPAVVETPVAVETPATVATEAPVSAETPEPAPVEAVAPEAVAPEAPAEAVAEVPAPAPAAEPAAPAEIKPVAEKAPPAPEARKKQTFDLTNPIVRELLNNLRWLVSEGYVTEFSDGRLFANPVRALTPPRNALAAAASATITDALAVPATFVPRPPKKNFARDRRRRGGANPDEAAPAATAAQKASEALETPTVETAIEEAPASAVEAPAAETPAVEVSEAPVVEVLPVEAPPAEVPEAPAAEAPAENV